MPGWLPFRPSQEKELERIKNDLHFYQLRIIEDTHRVQMLQEQATYIQNNMCSKESETNN